MDLWLGDTPQPVGTTDVFTLNGDRKEFAVRLGVSYTFTGSSIPPSHPFTITNAQTEPSGGSTTGAQFTALTGTQSAPWIPTVGGTYFYVCTSHHNMGYKIQALPAPPTTLLRSITVVTRPVTPSQSTFAHAHRRVNDCVDAS